MIAAALQPLHAATFAGVEVAPPLPAKPVVDTYFGTSVEDPYRFLEDTGDPVVQTWMRAQADATAAILANLPARDALLARLKEIDAAVPAVIGAVDRDARGGLTYLKRSAQENQFTLYRRERPGSDERVLVDVEPLIKATGKPHAIGGFATSPDGRYVAYGMSSGGTEIGTLHVIATGTGKEVMPPIDRIRGGGATWLADGSGFFYSRLAPDYASRPRAERFLDNRTHYRSLAAPSDERAVFGPGVHDAIPLDRSDYAFVVPVPGRNLALAIVTHGVSREISLYQAPLGGVIAGTARWQKVFDASASAAPSSAGPMSPAEPSALPAASP